MSKGVPFLARSSAHPLCCTLQPTSVDRLWSFRIVGWIMYWVGSAFVLTRAGRATWLKIIVQSGFPTEGRGTENLVETYPAHLSSSKPMLVLLPLINSFIIRPIFRVRSFHSFLRVPDYWPAVLASHVKLKYSRSVAYYIPLYCMITFLSLRSKLCPLHHWLRSGWPYPY